MFQYTNTVYVQEKLRTIISVIYSFKGLVVLAIWQTQNRVLYHVRSLDDVVTSSGHWLLAAAELYAPSPQLLGLERREDRKLAKDINTGDITCNREYCSQGGECYTVGHCGGCSDHSFFLLLKISVSNTPTTIHPDFTIQEERKKPLWCQIPQSLWSEAVSLAWWHIFLQEWFFFLL